MSSATPPSEDARLVYDVIDVSKSYGSGRRLANDSVSLRIWEGEVFGILGANGAGKTTLVEQLAALRFPTSGRITLYSRDVHVSEELVARKVGFMPQSAFALNNLTVDEAIYFAGHLRGLSHADALAERDRLVERLGLGDCRASVARRLSGGQRRLLQLGAAMAASPPILILDEPTSELDPRNRERVWATLRDVNETLRTTIVFITHDPVEAEKVIDRVAIMRDGRVVASGRPAELKLRVDRLLRLEVSVRLGAEPPAIGVPWQHLDGLRWRAYVERDQAVAAVSHLHDETVEEFRLYSPTLEDLYLHYVGRT